MIQAADVGVGIVGKEGRQASLAADFSRTLVVGRKKLSPEQYREFCTSYQAASLAINGRDAGMQRVISQHLE